MGLPLLFHFHQPIMVVRQAMEVLPSLALPATAPTWGLTLDLMTSSNRRRGSMNVHRLYQDHPLQLDVNILISEFPVALANALDRVIEHAVARVPLSKGDNGLVEAQAG